MSAPQVDVAIVGAGFAGLYLLHRCRQLGLTAQVWERGQGVGGTWYWNRYPGARCDIESLQYSYQFDPDLEQDWEWSERYAAQPELLTYAKHVADRYDLTRDIVLGREVVSAQYGDARWTLTATDGATLTAQFCVMATGCLTEPNWPVLEGYDAFDGPIYHTARWPHEGVDLAGKRVAVIGTGSSAVQSIPRIAEQAAHVTVFQRTPNYSVPARNAPLDPIKTAEIKADYRGLRARQLQAVGGTAGYFNPAETLSVSPETREAEYERRWQEGGLLFLGAFADIMLDKKANDEAVAFVHRKIRGLVQDPDVADMLCPDNIIGGKRLCADIDYYQTYNRPNVDLVDIRATPIEALNAAGLKVAAQQYDVDVIVVATGFDALTGALMKMDIRGKNNADLRAQWRVAPSSYLGLAMAGFPNLFTVTGPGSPSVLSNMLVSIEQHVEWISDCIAHMRTHGKNVIEATPEAEAEWWAHVQDLGMNALKSSTDSWYLGSNVAGKPRVFLPYLGGIPAYHEICRKMVCDGYRGFVIT